MKLLCVTQGVSMMGANRCLIDLLDCLRPLGVEGTIIVPQEGAFTEALKPKGHSFIVSPYHNWAHTKYISKEYWTNNKLQKENEQFLGQILEKVEADAYDIVYSNSSLLGIGAQLAEALGKPHLWHIREFGEKDYNKAFYKGRAHFNEWANRAAAVVSMSAAIDREVLQGVTAPRHILHDGIVAKESLDNIQPNSDHNRNPFTFLIIGAVRESKGQHIALEAFRKVHKKYPNTRLLIAGKGRRIFTLKLKMLCRLYGLSSAVEFLGYVSDPYKVHRDADSVLMCSVSEGMGRVTLEGMIFGNPVIGFNGGGTPELISHEKDGYIYNNGATELATYMERLVADRDLSTRLGQQGRKKIEERYTLETFAEKMYGILKAILPTKA